MNILTTIRSNEWWEYKFQLIHADGYVVVTNSGYRFADFWLIFILLLLSLITGAAYVSILNDVTDIRDDAAAKKINRMAKFSILNRILIVSIPLIIGFFFTKYFSADKLSMWLYIVCYLCFTLYSLPPFRLKKRGIIGIVADAAGSQLFPTLFVAAFLSFVTRQSINYYQFTFIGCWSFCFGVRGILWHQFHDLEKDLLSGTKTVVHNLNNSQIAVVGTLLICVELSAFTLLLYSFKLLLPAILMLFYFFYQFYAGKKLRLKLIIIKSTKLPYRMFMNEYYQVFFPLSILISAAFNQPFVLVILFFHLALFPVNTLRLFKEAYFIYKLAPAVQ